MMQLIQLPLYPKCLIILTPVVSSRDRVNPSNLTFPKSEYKLATPVAFSNAHNLANAEPGRLRGSRSLPNAPLYEPIYFFQAGISKTKRKQVKQHPRCLAKRKMALE